MNYRDIHQLIEGGADTLIMHTRKDLMSSDLPEEKSVEDFLKQFTVKKKKKTGGEEETPPPVSELVSDTEELEEFPELVGPTDESEDLEQLMIEHVPSKKIKKDKKKKKQEVQQAVKEITGPLKSDDILKKIELYKTNEV
jgi:hypothetical protein